MPGGIAVHLKVTFLRPKLSKMGAQQLSACFLFFHIDACRLSDYNSATVTMGHYEPVPPRLGNTISYLLAVNRSHVSAIHACKIGNGATSAFLPLADYLPINGIYLLPPTQGEVDN